jgi:hypothetical protein
MIPLIAKKMHKTKGIFSSLFQRNTKKRPLITQEHPRRKHQNGRFSNLKSHANNKKPGSKSRTS